ncbi:Putative 115 kDa protein in type-1 retrotransposable element R1DM [Eumeta japonica]|uniref:115 kDa protein in type-1 retrotransposable element R1DM n=1 Tax=Eumeta variegata TaxID=151549 RepID=A0A4C1ZKS6_EUMVA|nr:Putative 115 kDa protein in type-1 retrotransposable element R1DM [Eumeta japonica]
MANKCLELRYFPWAWTVADIEVIPKPGNAPPKSYRPIGLLSVLSKTVEVTLVVRLQWHVLPKPQATHGFKPQLLSRSSNIRAACWKRGQKEYFRRVEEDADRALAHVHCWRIKNKLRLSPPKTNLMVLTKKVKYDDPVVHINDEQISLVGEIRLIGLTIDRKLMFIPYVATICKKITNIYKDIARAIKVSWSLGPEIKRIIYIAVIVSIVLYASCVWAPTTRKLGVQKTLNTVQHSVPLKVCRAHRTVSLHSVLIHSRLFPLDIRGEKRSAV